MASNFALKDGSYQFLTCWDPNDPVHTPPPIQVVTCFIQKGNKILALQRARKDIQHGLWGIPGGKLDKNELPLSGLVRELREETGLDFSNSSFSLLGTTMSRTECDGQYGLYLYYTKISKEKEISINPTEHHAYTWVTLEEFENMDLLTAQGEAFKFVKQELNSIIK